MSINMQELVFLVRYFPEALVVDDALSAHISVSHFYFYFPPRKITHH